MAYIYGQSGHAAVTGADRRKELLLRLGLPLLFLFVLGAFGLYAFVHGHYLVTAVFIVSFVVGLLRFEDLGLTFIHHLSPSDTIARADHVVAKALRALPNDYHVFHDLRLYKLQIDHAVLGRNGFFLVSTKRHLGRVTLSGDSLRLNGWPFLQDPFKRGWKQSQALTKHLGLQYTAGIEITPVICFSRGSVGFSRLVRGVRVAQTSTLVQTIMNHEGAIPEERLMKLVDKLSELVCVKSAGVECIITQSEVFARPVHAKAGHVCAKCHHQASPLEMEFYPGECPRCGRLYAAGPVAPESDRPRQPKIAWRPSITRLALAAVTLLAAAAGLLVHLSGILTETPPDQNTRPVQADNATLATDTPLPGPSATTPEAAVAETKTEQNATSLDRPVAQGAPEDLLPTNGSGAVVIPSPERTAGDLLPKVQTNATAEAQANGTTSPAVPRDGADNAAAGVPPRPARAAATPEPKPGKPTDASATGTLTVTAPQPMSIWFTDQHSRRRLGPFEVGGAKAKDIVLPKGFYDVTFVENGRRRTTSISFLSDKGRLDL